MASPKSIEISIQYGIIAFMNNELTPRYWQADEGLSRRQFMAGMAAAGAALTLASPSAVLGQSVTKKRWSFIVFSKAFQELSYDDTADLVAEVGWDGIECPVRKGGQVLPERIEDDLPKMVAALKKRNCELTMMTTDIRNATDPLSVKALRTASKLGIRYYRLMSFRYRASQPIPDQLRELKPELRDLAALNKELGMCAGFQNHSGSEYIGAPVWDIFEVIKDLDRQSMGVFFDIGHATVEGGLAWPIHARLMEPLYRSIYVKDFTWQKAARDWQVKWCPLGQGMIHPSFFQNLRKSAFTGPISQHFEYPIGTGKERVQTMKKDLETLKGWLAV